MIIRKLEYLVYFFLKYIFKTYWHFRPTIPVVWFNKIEKINKYRCSAERRLLPLHNSSLKYVRFIQFFSLQKSFGTLHIRLKELKGYVVLLLNPSFVLFKTMLWSLAGKFLIGHLETILWSKIWEWDSLSYVLGFFWFF